MWKATAAALASMMLVAAAASPQEALPRDVYADTRNRLPGGEPGAAAIRSRGTGTDVRWSSRLGRQLTELAILTGAREHDQPYEWSLHEPEAVAIGLAPAVIDVVRHRRPVGGIDGKQAMIIAVGRELFRTHRLRFETYARIFDALGESSLVDLISLMADYTATSALLSAFNQQMPPGWRQTLTLSFALPNDIRADSRNRLPLVKSTPPTMSALYSRNLAPVGTGPGQIRAHGAGIAALEGNVGRRLVALAILATARAHDAQYAWTMNEPMAVEAGLEPSVIEIVRGDKPLEGAGLAERDAALIQFARELFAKHYVTVETYARAQRAFGERDLVDLVGLMARQAGDTVLEAAFDQRLPAGTKPLLPIP